MTRVGEESGESNHRPAADQEYNGLDSGEDRRAKSLGRNQPDGEGPQEELRHDHEGDCSSNDLRPIAITPSHGGGENEERRDGADLEGPERGMRGENGAVAAPVVYT